MSYQSDLRGRRNHFLLCTTSFYLSFLTLVPSLPLQKAVPWGLASWADTGDDAEGRCGPHATPNRTHHTPDQGFSRCLCSSLHPGAQSAKLWVQRGAKTAAPCQERLRHLAKEKPNEHIYWHVKWHSTKFSTALLKGGGGGSRETERKQIKAAFRMEDRRLLLALTFPPGICIHFSKAFRATKGAIGTLVCVNSRDRDPGWAGSGARLCSRMEQLKADLFCGGK